MRGYQTWLSLFVFIISYSIFVLVMIGCFVLLRFSFLSAGQEIGWNKLV